MVQWFLIMIFHDFYATNWINRKVILYITASLDGYIARKDGSIDWLSGDGSDPNIDNGYSAFCKTVDTIIMGSKTYEQIIN